jgi:hypothetical protein
MGDIDRTIKDAAKQAFVIGMAFGAGMVAIAAIIMTAM